MHRRIIISAMAMLLAAGTVPAVSAAEDTLMHLAGNIHQFNSEFPQEKVYLQFDNTAYFQGEVIWFKAFVTHATTLKRAPSKVLYVELLSPNGVVLKQHKLKIVAGQCDGAFPLIDESTSQSRALKGMQSYPSGFYEIRAYTQNMFDFNTDSFFSRVLPVLSKPKKDGDFSSGTILKPKKAALELESIRVEDENGNRNINVAFYPEGGSLVRGLPGNVAFKATDASGLPLSGTLTLPDDAGEAVTLHEGMGSFLTTPSGTIAQTVLFTDESGKSRRVRLPSALKSGYSMLLNIVDDSCIRADIYRTGDRNEDELGISVTCRGELIHFEKVKGQESVSTDMDASDWPIGVCRITLYSKKGEILSSRSFFHNNTEFTPPSIEILTDSMSRSPFSREVLRMRLTGQDGTPLRDRFCLSVRDAADYGTGSVDNLMSNLLLSSDLRGYIHNPDYYMESDDSIHRAALDLLTLVQGWERYEWKVMTGQTGFRERYRVEDSLNVNGQVLSFSKYKPVPDINVLATVTPYDDKTAFESFQYTTDSTGYFGFDLSDFYNWARMSIKLTSRKRNGKVKYETDTRIKLDYTGVPEPRAISELEKFQDSHNSRKSAKTGVSDTGQPEDTLATVIDIDEGILLDEVDIIGKRQFIDYDTFKAWNVEQAAFQELDKGEYTTNLFGYLIRLGYDFYFPTFFYVHYRDKVPNDAIIEDPYTLDMMSIRSVLVYDEPMTKPHIYPLVPLLNEKKRHQMDTNYFMDMLDLNPEGGPRNRIQKYFLIDVQLKEEHELPTRKDLRNLSDRTTMVRGFSEPVEFYGPAYPTGPVIGDVDYRRTLYWNPNVITDEEGNARVEFYNNSYSRRFSISGAGITASGTPYVLDEDF
ncbi:MAG: hypothetical protein J6U22_08455 [Bacteroidaceae bacterium]|nr:hypothetical protein [Bacteroidaceae bacterium]